MHHRTSDRILTPFAIALAIALFLIVSVAHNGLVLAIVQEASETPIDTPTAEAFTETPTETATEAPTDTATQTPIVITATPEPPTETPLPTDTPRPTETTLPTETTIPTETPNPTETPAPTDTPVPPVEPPAPEPPLPDQDTSILVVVVAFLSVLLALFAGAMVFFGRQLLNALPPWAKDLILANQEWVKQRADAALDELDRRAALTPTLLDDQMAAFIRKSVEDALRDILTEGGSQLQLVPKKPDGA